MERLRHHWYTRLQSVMEGAHSYRPRGYGSRKDTQAVLARSRLIPHRSSLLHTPRCDATPQDQSQSDAILDDLACMLGCTRSSLNGGYSCGGLLGGVA